MGTCDSLVIGLKQTMFARALAYGAIAAVALGASADELAKVETPAARPAMQPHLTMADLLKTHVEVQNKFNDALDVNTLRAKNRRLRKAAPFNAAGKRISKTTQAKAKAELPPKKSLFKGAADRTALKKGMKAFKTAPTPPKNNPFAKKADKVPLKKKAVKSDPTYDHPWVAKTAPKKAKAGASPNPFSTLKKTIEAAPAPQNNPFVAKKVPKRAKAGASPNPFLKGKRIKDKVVASKKRSPQAKPPKKNPFLKRK